VSRKELQDLGDMPLRYFWNAWLAK
jgi:hypothetical protein